MLDRGACSGERLLLSCFACDPTKGSECYVGWNWATAVYADFPRVILTRKYHRAVLEKQIVPGAEFAYFDLPFCSHIGHHANFMKLYYMLWQLLVLPYAGYLVIRRKLTVVQHITYNTLDYPGFLWLIPGVDFIWGPVGGGQVPPESLKSYYGSKWKQQICRAFVKRMSWANPLLRSALRRGRLVLAANSDTCRILDGLIGNKGRLHRVLETSIHAIGTERTLSSEPIQVIWVGRFEPRKAPHLAIEISERMHALAPGRFAFRLIGEGEMWEEVRDLAVGVADTIVSAPVPFLEMHEVYRRSDLMIFTSLQDTSGNVVLESIAQGIPVVAFDHQGAADMLRGGGGLLVPPTRKEEVIEGFCDALLTLAQSDTYAAVSRAGIENVMANYLWSAKRKAVLRLLAETSGSRAARSCVGPVRYS